MTVCLHGKFTGDPSTGKRRRAKHATWWLPGVQRTERGLVRGKRRQFVERRNQETLLEAASHFVTWEGEKIKETRRESEKRQHQKQRGERMSRAKWLNQRETREGERHEKHTQQHPASVEVWWRESGSEYTKDLGTSSTLDKWSGRQNCRRHFLTRRFLTRIIRTDDPFRHKERTLYTK